MSIDNESKVEKYLRIYEEWLDHIGGNTFPFPKEQKMGELWEQLSSEERHEVSKRI